MRDSDDNISECENEKISENYSTADVDVDMLAEKHRDPFLDVRITDITQTDTLTLSPIAASTSKSDGLSLITSTIGASKSDSLISQQSSYILLKTEDFAVSQKKKVCMGTKLKSKEKLLEMCCCFIIFIFFNF